MTKGKEVREKDDTKGYGGIGSEGRKGGGGEIGEGEGGGGGRGVGGKVVGGAFTSFSKVSLRS